MHVCVAASARYAIRPASMKLCKSVGFTSGGPGAPLNNLSASMGFKNVDYEPEARGNLPIFSSTRELLLRCEG